METVIAGYSPKMLISSRSYSGKHFLITWFKSLHGFSLWNYRNIYAPRSCHHHTDNAGYDITQAIGAGVKKYCKYILKLYHSIKVV